MEQGWGKEKMNGYVRSWSWNRLGGNEFRLTEATESAHRLSFLFQDGSVGVDRSEWKCWIWYYRVLWCGEYVGRILVPARPLLQWSQERKTRLVWQLWDPGYMVGDRKGLDDLALFNSYCNAGIWNQVLAHRVGKHCTTEPMPPIE